METPTSPDPSSNELMGSGTVVGATGDSDADHVEVMFPPEPSNAKMLGIVTVAPLGRLPLS